MEQYYVYILTNKVNTTLYIGVTNNLIRRIYEHKHKLIPGFSSRYHLVKLVYYEIYEQIENAISRAKQLKNGNRERKINLINSFNPGWKDIYDDICR